MTEPADRTDPEALDPEAADPEMLDPDAAAATEAELAARRAAARAAHRARLAAAADKGGRIIQLDYAGTAVFTVAALVGTAIDGFPRNAAAVVAFVLFAVGIVLFFGAYARAVARSRFDEISVGGLYLMLGSTPGRVQARLLGCLGVQAVVAVATAIATRADRPFTPLAFGLLVPMFGLACCGLWAAVHGVFPARQDPRASLAADD
jgi:hypothetical protein